MVCALGALGADGFLAARWLRCSTAIPIPTATMHTAIACNRPCDGGLRTTRAAVLN